MGVFFTHPHLEDACRDARRVHGLIIDAMEGLTAEGTHQLIAAGLHRAALSHLWSISLLFDYTRPASAFALLRSAIETGQRALYVQRCHTDDLLNAIARDDRNAFGAYKDMLKELEDTVFGYRYREQLLAIWPDLCSYCHGGKKQIDRQYNGDGNMIENFSLVDSILAMHQASTFLVHVTYLMIEDLCGNSIRADIFYSRFLFRLPW